MRSYVRKRVWIDFTAIPKHFVQHLVCSSSSRRKLTRVPTEKISYSTHAKSLVHSRHCQLRCLASWIGGAPLSPNRTIVEIYRNRKQASAVPQRAGMHHQSCVENGWPFPGTWVT